MRYYPPKRTFLLWRNRTLLLWANSFANIARRAKPKNTEFKLGFGFSDKEEATPNFQLQIILSEKPDGSEPVIKEMHFIFDDGEIRLVPKEELENDEDYQISVKRKRTKKVFTVSMHKSAGAIMFLAELQMRLRNPDRRFRRNRAADRSSIPEEDLFKFAKEKGFLDLDRFLFCFQHFSFAPIRSKPQRTYDPLEEVETSTGNEIPLVLRNLSLSNQKDWQKLEEKLIRFGKLSGLFTDIQVRQLGRSFSDPFQLEFRVRSASATNLIDVGYGVSQILPILVRTLTMENYTFLMQQPEVHLHPKAQAELTSLLIELSKQKNNSFIIETHSDYMVDRARIEIMEGRILKDNVSLIYLEAKGKEVEVHNIKLDRAGNLLNPPTAYREFFLKETSRLLGLKD